MPPCSNKDSQGEATSSLTPGGINAAKYDWESLGQIFEIGQIISTFKLDWTNLVEQAETLGCKRIVLLGLSLASRFFSTPLPVAATEELKKDKSVQQLSAEIATRLIQTTETSEMPLQLDRLRARSRERLRERLPHYRRMLRHILTPNEKDREFLPLPNLLFALYFIIRPIRLIHKHSSKIIHFGTKNTASESEQLGAKVISTFHSRTVPNSLLLERVS